MSGLPSKTSSRKSGLSVLSANTLVDSHAWICTKSAIIIKPPGKDIPLSDKGSVQRKEVYQMFESDIPSVYVKL